MEKKLLLGKLLRDLEKLSNSGYNCDVKINVGEEPNAGEFLLHSSILSFRCSYFKKELEKATKQDGYYIFEKKNISEFIFQIILKYLYTSKIELSGHPGTVILELLMASNELELDSFWRYTNNYFIENHMDYIKENTVKIIRLIYTLSNFNALKNVCLKEICADSDKLFESTEFELLKKSTLMEILERDDFDVDEIKVWENILKWGFAKHPEINGVEVEDWLIQNLFVFERTIKEFIPLIRFRDISNEDFSEKVMPYQMLFPIDLWKTILNYYLITDKQATSNLLPSRYTVIESAIINRKLILFFANCIDKKNPPYTSFSDLRYDFKLLYRSSRDGLNEDTFHQKCDNINKTLMVARIQSTGKIIGGYNPLNWNSQNNIVFSGTYKAADSFIFNIPDRNNLNNALFSYPVNNYGYAIYCHSNQLPAFGRGADLSFLTNGSICSNPMTYDDIGLPKNGSAYDEMEVFQIIDKGK